VVSLALEYKNVSQLFCIPHRRIAKKTSVLPAEVGSVIVAYRNPPIWSPNGCMTTRLKKYQAACRLLLRRQGIVIVLKFQDLDQRNALTTAGRSACLLGRADSPSCPLAVEHRPADLVSQPLVLQDEFVNRIWKLFALPTAL
jgi:hypothetical protein